MKRYIDKDKLIKELSTMYKSPTSAEDFMTVGYDHAIADVVVTIYEQPTADVVERKVGKWKVYNILDYAQRPTGRKVGKCPFCGRLTDEFRTLIECNAKLTSFCPNCGAEMRGEDDG